MLCGLDRFIQWVRPSSRDDQNELVRYDDADRGDYEDPSNSLKFSQRAPRPVRRRVIC